MDESVKAPLITDVTTYETFTRMVHSQRSPLLTDSVDEDIEGRGLYPDLNDNDSESEDDISQEDIQIRRSAHLTSDLGTFMHMIKGSIGTGLLGLPWAMKHAGIIAGPLMLIMMAVICIHCMHILVKCSKHLCRQLHFDCLDYGDVMLNSVRHGPIKCLQPHAQKAKILINVFLMITQLGFCCVYFVFMGQNIRQVVAIYWKDAPEDRIFMAMLAIPVILLTFIRKLSVLAWFSSAANIATVISLCIIFRYIIPDLPSVSSRPFIADIAEFPVFFGTAIFAFEGIGVVLPIENAMRTPSHFPFIINLSMLMVSFLYTSVGVLGYLKFGPAICGSITLNLPVGEPFYDMAKILFSFVIFVSYAIQFYVPLEIIWPVLKKKFDPKNGFCEAVTRMLIVVFTCMCAIAIPNIGDYIALIGACSSSFLALIFPPIIEMMTFHSRSGEAISDDRNGDRTSLINSANANKSRMESQYIPTNARNEGLPVWVVLKNILILTIGIVGFIAGTVVALKDIVYDLQHHSKTDACSGGLGPVNTTTAVPIFNHTTPFVTSMYASTTAPFSMNLSEISRP